VGSWKPPRAVAIAVLGASTLALAGTAFASGGRVPAKAKVLIAGGESFEPNQYLKIGGDRCPGHDPELPVCDPCLDAGAVLGQLTS
jgi:hypothetical protein